MDGFSVFISLCSFQANGLFADRTDWSIHTAPPGKGYTQILARSLGIAKCQIFRGSDRVGPVSPRPGWYSSPCGRENQIHPACRHLNQEVCRITSNRAGVGLAHFNTSLDQALVHTVLFRTRSAFVPIVGYPTVLGKIAPGDVGFCPEMRDYDSQKWFDLYRTAILELQRAAITGRIRDARSEITTRLETLRQHPDLHHTELSAIHDALNNLRVLEREEERMAAEDKKRILQQTVQKLKSIAPRFGESDQQ